MMKLNVKDGCPLCGAPLEQAKLCCAGCGEEIEQADGYGCLTFEPSYQRIYCHACKTAFEPYLCGDVERELLRGVREGLVARSEGRNLSCWPLCSFSGEDADLSPEGCTGIKRISGTDEARILFEVGGHKTVCGMGCLPGIGSRERHEAFEERVREYVCHSGFSADFDGEDFTLSYSDTIAAEAVLVDGVADIQATVEKIIGEAKSRTDAFEQEMVGLDKIVDSLYKETCARILMDVALAAGPLDREQLSIELREVVDSSGYFLEPLAKKLEGLAESLGDCNKEAWGCSVEASCEAWIEAELDAEL